MKKVKLGLKSFITLKKYFRKVRVVKNYKKKDVNEKLMIESITVKREEKLTTISEEMVDKIEKRQWGKQEEEVDVFGPLVCSNQVDTYDTYKGEVEIPSLRMVDEVGPKRSACAAIRRCRENVVATNNSIFSSSFF